MMLDRVDCRAEGLAGELLRDKLGDPRPGTPITQPIEHQIDVRALEQEVPYFAQQVCATVLIKGDVIYIRKADACFT